MINQYISIGKTITQFVLLVDESMRIQEELDSSDKKNIHRSLRESLLTTTITIMNRQPLKSPFSSIGKDSIGKDTTIILKTCLLSLKVNSKKFNLKESYWKTIQDVIYKLDQIYLSNSTTIILGEFLEVAVKGIIETRLNALT
jgi:hypothetical protein